MDLRRLYYCQGMAHNVEWAEIEPTEEPHLAKWVLDETVDGMLLTEKDPRAFGWSAVLVTVENVVMDDRGDYFVIGEGRSLDWYCPECRDEAVARGAR